MRRNVPPRLLAQCLLLLVLLALPVAAAVAQEATYTVRQGDTLYRIATDNGMTVDGLKALNGLISNDIRIGQVLAIRPEEPLPQMPDSVVVGGTVMAVGPVQGYRVRPGDTYYTIAADIGTKANFLAALNGGGSAPLEVGSRIVVPGETEGRREVAVGAAAPFPKTYAGRTMAGGDAYDPAALVASHRDLPLGTILLLEHRSAGRATFAVVADRGPVNGDLAIEVSDAAADALELSAGDDVHIWIVE